MRTQYGALPFRITEDGVRILLATSRETRRWVIPKGWAMKGKSPHRAAAQEAFEEAGVSGTIGERAIGSYEYDKRLKDGAIVVCHVDVFPLAVEKQRRKWPEWRERETSWFDPADAAAAVQEPELASIISGLPSLLAARAKI